MPRQKGIKLQTIKNNKNSTARALITLEGINRFFAKYDDPKTMERIADIIQGTDKISLRILDSFAKVYSKKHNVLIGGKHIYATYKNKKSVKTKFDAFKRHDLKIDQAVENLNFTFTKEKIIKTTIGQLNFFRWIIEHNVLIYIDLHFEEIETELKNSKKIKKQAKKIEIKVEVEE